MLCLLLDAQAWQTPAISLISLSPALIAAYPLSTSPGWLIKGEGWSFFQAWALSSQWILSDSNLIAKTPSPNLSTYNNATVASRTSDRHGLIASNVRAQQSAFQYFLSFPGWKAVSSCGSSSARSQSLTHCFTVSADLKERLLWEWSEVVGRSKHSWLPLPSREECWLWIILQGFSGSLSREVSASPCSLSICYICLYASKYPNFFT